MRHRRLWLLAALMVSACSLYLGEPEHTPHVVGPDAGTVDHDGGCGGEGDGGSYDVDAGEYGGPDGGIVEVDAGGNDGGIALPDAW